MNILKCSKCDKQFNNLIIFDCQNCAGKKCLACGKKKMEKKYGLIDYDSQLECSRCGKKKSFLFPKYEYQKKQLAYCQQCSEKDNFPSDWICFCQFNENNFFHCNLCNEKLLPLECYKCHLKKKIKGHYKVFKEENIDSNKKNMKIFCLQKKTCQR